MNMLSFFKRTVPCLILGVASLPACALSFEQTLELLMEESLQAKADSVAAVAEMADLSTFANLPDPEIEGERLWAAGEGENKWNATIGWTIDWPGAYKARRDEASARKLVAAARNAVERREIMRSLAGTLTEYISAEKKIRLLERQLEATVKMGELVGIMSEHGKATALDESKISIERGRLMAALQQARDARQSAVTELGLAAGCPAARILGECDPEFASGAPMSLEEWEKGYRSSPEMLLADKEYDAAAAGLKSVSAEFFPEISLGYIHAYEEGTHFNGGRLGLSIPIFSQRGKKEAARRGKEAAEAALELVRENKKMEAARLVERLKGLKQSLDELGPVFDTTSPEALLRKSFEAGQITLLTYLTERNYYLEAEMDYIELQGAYSLLLSKLRLL